MGSGAGRQTGSRPDFLTPSSHLAARTTSGGEQAPLELSLPRVVTLPSVDPASNRGLGGRLCTVPTPVLLLVPSSSSREEERC